MKPEASAFEHLAPFYPSEVNSEQEFDFADLPAVKRMKIFFPEGTDFYGRIIVYKLDVLGRRVEWVVGMYDWFIHKLKNEQR